VFAQLAPSLAVALAAGEGAPTSGSPPPALVEALRTTPAGGARAAAATRALVGAPYRSSPLGEGEGPDPDPRFRLDAFDCMTFVETALALGSTGSLAEAALALDDIRYSGPPALAARNHEVLSQWIPANLAKGWIAELPLAGARREEKVYTAESWAAVRRAGRAIAGLPRAKLPLGTFSVAVVAPADAPAAAASIEEGAVVFVVRADAADRATRITHAGLLVGAPGAARRVRHATSSVKTTRVIEESLERFLHRESSAWPSWPVVGLAFFAAPDQHARVAALASAARRAEPGPPRRPPAPDPAPRP
jgi:hypothetical protein